MRNPSLLFGVPLDDLTMDETLDEIAALVIDGRRNDRAHQIATVNVDFLVSSITRPAVKDILQTTSVNLVDGLPVVWGARLAGLPVRQRVTGADLVGYLARESAARGWRVHFFGSTQDVIERALVAMRAAHPGADLSGECGPVLTDVDDIDESVVDAIRSHDADILCVALGHPKQELFIRAHRKRLGVPVLIGIGGSLDMYVGDRRRAPGWVQRSGTEWLYRTAQEPRRLAARYARDARLFTPHLVRYVRRLRRHRSGPGVSIRCAGDTVHLATVDGSGDIDASDAIRRIIDGAGLSVDLSRGVPRPRSLGVAIGVSRVALQRNRPRTVTNVSSTTRSALVDGLGVATWFVDDSETPDSSAKATR